MVNGKKVIQGELMSAKEPQQELIWQIWWIGEQNTSVARGRRDGGNEREMQHQAPVGSRTRGVSWEVLYISTCRFHMREQNNSVW